VGVLANNAKGLEIISIAYTTKRQTPKCYTITRYVLTVSGINRGIYNKKIWISSTSSESFIVNELYELEQRGHEVSIFSLRRPDGGVTHDEIEEIDLTAHYGEIPSLSSLPELSLKRVLNQSVFRRAAFVDDPLHNAKCLHLGKQLIEPIDAESGVDLIHAHFAGPNRLAVKYAAAYLDVPCTFTAHANERFSNPNVRRLHRVCSRFDHIVMPSKYNKRYLRDNIGVETGISVVPTTNDVDKFNTSNDYVPGRLLTVARLIEKKGYKYAIDAVAELVDRGYDIEYYIVGTGPQEASLPKWVEDDRTDE